MTRKNKGKARAAPNDKPVAALPLGKQLAHTDKQVRDRAIASLVAFVSAGTQDEPSSSAGYRPLAQLDMDRLWKGLFYCFWMSDKPLVQQRLAADLAELVISIQPAVDGVSEDDREVQRFDAALGFLAGFWRSMVREWHGIDRLRVDKFYMLIRRYVNATFRLLARGGWKEDQVDRVNAILASNGGPVTADVSVPKAIATHLSDIYLEELDKVLGLPEVDTQVRPSSPALSPASWASWKAGHVGQADRGWIKGTCPTVEILRPHIALLALTPTQTVYNRLMSTLFTPLLDALALASPSTSDDRPAKRTKDEPMFPHIVMRSRLSVAGSDGAVSPGQLKQGLLKALFEVAADEKAVETNRRKIYRLVRDLGDDDDDDDGEE